MLDSANRSESSFASRPDENSILSRFVLDWRYEVAAVLTVFSAVTSLFFFEVVFLGRTIVPVHALGVMGTVGAYGFQGQSRPDPYRVDLGVFAWGMEPWVRKAGNEYAAGRFPLWNEHQGFGSPLLADAQPGAMDPLRLPVLLNGSPLSWDLYFLARVVLGMLASYLFARKVGLALPARLFLAIAFAFSGHFLIFGNNTWVETYFLLPVILLGTELAVTRQTRLGFAVTAASVALSILGGMPEATLFVLLAGAAYGGWRLIWLGREGGFSRAWAERTALLVGAWLVGTALSGPLLLTLYEFTLNSSKVATARGTMGLGHETLANTVVWFIPFLQGLPLAPIKINQINNYVGATVTTLALLSLYPTRTKHFKLLVPFSAIASALLLAKIFGVPGINELGGLPPFNVAFFPKWSAPVASFFLVLLASVSVHRLATDRWCPLPAGLATIAFLWLALVGFLLNWNMIIHTYADHVLRTMGEAFFFATAVWAITQLRRWLRPTLIGLACCGLVALELFTYAPRNAYQDRYDRFTEPPFVKFLRSQQSNGPFRIFALDAILFPNTSSVFGIDDVRSLDALYIDRYLSYINNFVTPEVYHSFSGFPPASGHGETSFIGNRWFDLPGIRYIVVNPEGGFSSMFRGGIFQEIVAADKKSGQPSRIGVESLTIDGITKPWLSQHPPMSIRYTTKITPSRSALRFSLALSPKVWDPSLGDGVGFEVAVEVDGKQERLYRRQVDPKNDPSQRRWIHDSVDLSRFIGRDAVLILTTDPLMGTASDWAGWGDIRLTPASSELADPQAGSAIPQFALVYDREVKIFENRQALTRVFLVDSILPVADMNGAIVAMKQEGIDPTHTAVVEGTPPGAAATLQHGGGEATIRTYNATNTLIDVDAKERSFLVLTDSFYPGWRATVDGREVPIYATDLAFRGIFVPEGRHRVEFYYRPASFILGMALALVGLIALVTVAAGISPRRLLAARRARSVKNPLDVPTTTT